jgi:putative membrane protein
MAIFTEQEKQAVEARIEAAERRTAAEIVVAAIPRSDDYTGVRLASVALMALSAGATAIVAMPWLRAGEVLGIQLLLGLLVYFLSGLPPVLRRLAPSAHKASALERATQLAFMRHSVFATRERTGVLILLSELEHRVAILGDEGIHARVKTEGWEQHVDTMVRAVRAGAPGKGVCEVVDALAEILAEGAPIRSDDSNELPNRVRED